MSHTYYILDENKTPIPATVQQFAEMYKQSGSRIVKQTELIEDGVSVKVSTVFLGLDHAWGDSEPQLFETMVFGGSMDEEQWRYATWAASETHHDEVVKLITASVKELVKED